MEKRVLFAVSLSFLVLVVYQTLFVKPRKPAPTGVTTIAGPQTPGAQASADSSAPLEADRPASPAAAAAPAANAIVSDTTARDVIVETEWVRAVFSTRGAVLKSWVLKHYLDANGKPVDMIPAVNGIVVKPFGVTVVDHPAQTNTLRDALFRPSAESLALGAKPGSIAFEYRDASGLTARKEFQFQPDQKPYVLQVGIKIAQNDEPLKVQIHGGTGIGDIERSVKPTGYFGNSSYQLPEAIYQQNTDVVREHFSAISQRPVAEGNLRYAGVDDHYFLGALLSTGDVNVRADFTPVAVITPSGPRELVDYKVRVAGNPESFKFFYGPKDFDILASVDRELVRSIHFGFFSFLAVPLLRALKWVNAYIGNYGWSIVALTILINLVMFPLRHKSVVSMRKMQELQPQVKAIQDRYAKLKTTDPARQKMNTELMALYKEKGVNPASGCVPMLMTLPVLFAFYSLLSVAIELRGAPFTLWIHDLSRNDPYFVTPVLMAITQFIQTKMTPATGDPAQQKMMMFMPLMFMVFFLWAPSGLVIYWFVSNLWSIGQQVFTNRLIGPPPQVGSRPSTERKMKRVNGAPEGAAAR
jgi:YidC/Oxa1 family membrane protein insertase